VDTFLFAATNELYPPQGANPGGDNVPGNDLAFKTSSLSSGGTQKPLPRIGVVALRDRNTDDNARN